MRKRPDYRVWGSILTLAVVVFAVSGASWFAPQDPNAQISPALNRYLPPSATHWFGTDQFGRDVFARVLYGGRFSLFIAFSVVCGSLILGTLYGAISGYAGGILDQVLMRLVDIFLAFPIIFLAVTCMALFGSGLFFLIVVLIMTGWMDIARLVRAEIQSIKRREFVLRAHSAGLRTWRILLRHLLPNVTGIIVTAAIIRVADIILLESALSFLGLGVQPPTASWGSIVNDGRTVLASAWWVAAFPGMAIVVTIISLHLAAESLQYLKKSVPWA